jgi:hypothetical protein
MPNNIDKGNSAGQDTAQGRTGKSSSHTDHDPLRAEQSNQWTFGTTRRASLEDQRSHPGHSFAVRETTITDRRGKELSEGSLALTAGVEVGPDDRITPPHSTNPIRVVGKLRNCKGIPLRRRICPRGSRSSGAG